MNFKKIFAIESFKDGVLQERRFARNISTARKIQIQMSHYDNRVYIEECVKSIWCTINPEWVEG